MKKKLLLAYLLFFAAKVHAQNIISEKKLAASFPIVSDQMAYIVVNDEDDSLVQKAAILFQKDIEMVSGKKPVIVSS
ncbi:MAG: glycosyhydrolase, partial [Flavisolibacter sp.]|nr:glycosyhydrolase [Flavisolibacter sp.]